MNHGKIERNVFLLMVLTLLVASVGGIVQIFPLFIKEVSIEKVEGMRPNTPLELAGFDLFKREGCYNCHSQQVRYLRDEVERYGHYSLAAESMYDFPFQWGSKRTGPDLARVGGKYTDDWHIPHLINPRSVVPESIMPSYPWFARNPLDTGNILAEMKILKMLGVPYSDEDIANWEEDIKIQLALIDDSAKVESFQKRYPNATIRKFNNKSADITEMDAIVGYLQGIGNRVNFKTNQGRDW
jgi:cytochrome c oxidase cbb3-type subunit 2